MSTVLLRLFREDSRRFALLSVSLAAWFALIMLIVRDADATISAKTNMVVSRATVWQHNCAFCRRQKRVKSGMLSDSVAQNPIMPVSDGMNTGRNSANVSNLPGCESSGPKPFAAFTAHTSRMPVTTTT